MAVSNPATFSSIKAEFGGSNKFSDYYRGGPYVASNASSTIATSASLLRMSQFNGVSKPSTALAASANNISGFALQKGTYTIGVVTVTATGGTGSYTYGTAALYSGEDSNDNSNISLTNQAGNQFTFRATNINSTVSSSEPIVGTWRVLVTSGASSVYATFTVSWG